MAKKDTTTVDVSGNDFMSKIASQLMGQSNVISSTGNALQQRVQSAISGVQKSADATRLAIESQYNREADFQSGQADLATQTHLEGRTGFATQMVAFRNLVETTDKSLKDLEQRKQELILQNDAAAASKISDLQMKAIEYQQQAQQQVFSNLLALGNFGMQAQQEARLAKQQTFAEKQALGNIALEYGLTVQPGDTIDSLVARAMPIASEQKRLELLKTQADINNANAQAAKAAKGEGVKTLNPIDIDALGRTLARYDYNTPEGKTIIDGILTSVDEKGGATAIQKVLDAKNAFVTEQQRIADENTKRELAAKAEAEAAAKAAKNEALRNMFGPAKLTIPAGGKTDVLKSLKTNFSIFKKK